MSGSTGGAAGKRVAAVVGFQAGDGSKPPEEEWERVIRASSSLKRLGNFADSVQTVFVPGRVFFPS